MPVERQGTKATNTRYLGLKTPQTHWIWILISASYSFGIKGGHSEHCEISLTWGKLAPFLKKFPCWKTLSQNMVVFSPSCKIFLKKSLVDPTIYMLIHDAYCMCRECLLCHRSSVNTWHGGTKLQSTELECITYFSDAAGARHDP